MNRSATFVKYLLNSFAIWIESDTFKPLSSTRCKDVSVLFGFKLISSLIPFHNSFILLFFIKVLPIIVFLTLSDFIDNTVAELFVRFKESR